MGESSKAWRQQLSAEVFSAHYELMKYLTHPDRSTEDRREQRWELSKQVVPFFDAVAAAREGGLRVKADPDGTMITFEG
jgi:hypothetical protein